MYSNRNNYSILSPCVLMIEYVLNLLVCISTPILNFIYIRMFSNTCTCLIETAINIPIKYVY